MEHQVRVDVSRSPPLTLQKIPVRHRLLINREMQISNFQYTFIIYMQLLYTSDAVIKWDIYDIDFACAHPSWSNTRAGRRLSVEQWGQQWNMFAVLQHFTTSPMHYHKFPHNYKVRKSAILHFTFFIRNTDRFCFISLKLNLNFE